MRTIETIIGLMLLVEEYDYDLSNETDYGAYCCERNVLLTELKRLNYDWKALVDNQFEYEEAGLESLAYLVPNVIEKVMVICKSNEKDPTLDPVEDKGTIEVIDLWNEFERCCEALQRDTKIAMILDIK